MALVVDVEAIHSWLTARLDEDEQHADQVHDVGCAMVLDGALNRSCDCGEPDQIRREVEAKRRILDEYEKALDRRRLFRDDVASAGALLQMVAVVKLLALPYPDRDDFPAELRLP